jgi:hypothetical protein
LLLYWRLAGTRITPGGEADFFNKRMADSLGVDVAGTNEPGMSRLDAVIESVHPEDAPKFTFSG